MLSPEYTDEFTRYLNKHSLKYAVAIDDLQKWVVQMIMTKSWWFRLLIEKESQIELNKHLNDSVNFARMDDDPIGGFRSQLRLVYVFV